TAVHRTAQPAAGGTAEALQSRRDGCPRTRRDPAIDQRSRNGPAKQRLAAGRPRHPGDRDRSGLHREAPPASRPAIEGLLLPHARTTISRVSRLHRPLRPRLIKPRVLLALLRPLRRVLHPLLERRLILRNLRPLGRVI